MVIDLVFNSSLESLFEDPTQIIILDANFLISPNRFGKIFPFDKFKRIWLDPIFSLFQNFSIHEAVYRELVDLNSKEYIDNKPGITIHQDSSLTLEESALRNTLENKIAKHTKYIIEEDNKDDRGEVKSLAFIAVKNYFYFASNDNNAINLIEKAEEWGTGLDNVNSLKMYELIYYLYKKSDVSKKDLKMLYKYYYYFTNREKTINPAWGDFIQKMDDIYNIN